MGNNNNRNNLRPWHLWVIVIVATFFMLFGLYDFIMVATHNMDYLTDRYTPEGVRYFTNYPLGLLVLFGINVIGGMLASVVALWNKLAAMWLAIVSGVSDVVLLVFTIFFRNRFEAIGAGPTLQDIAICVGLFALAGYFWWLHREEQRLFVLTT
jgi:hypothetical protein